MSLKHTQSAFIITVSLVFALHCSAAMLSDYHKRINTARTDVTALRRLENESQTFQRLKTEKIDDIYRVIPQSERVEWQGGSIETDNQWLLDGLGNYVDESDSDKRQTILLGIEGRLSAIGEKIDGLEKATAADRAKDDDKQKLAEILRREEYQKPEAKEASIFQKWWREFTEWLEKFFPRSPSLPETDQGFGSLKFLIQILVYAAVIGVIAFLLYRFWPQIASRFGHKKKDKKRDRVILGELINADESAADLFSEAEQLARDGRLRDAIRKGYIAALCELSDRKMIGLARHKTNRDYLRDIGKRTGLFENMKNLTGAFERNWYGLRPSQQNDWEDFREKYQRTITEV